MNILAIGIGIFWILMAIHWGVSENPTDQATVADVIAITGLAVIALSL